MGRKLGAVPLLGVDGSLSNITGHLTKSPGPEPTYVPSGISVHPVVWPQRTWAESWGCAPLAEGSWVPI